jgi:hypothetical protein
MVWRKALQAAGARLRPELPAHGRSADELGHLTRRLGRGRLAREYAGEVPVADAFAAEVDLSVNVLPASLRL